jgi:aspartate-semialdehyde dehydrogenase
MPDNQERGYSIGLTGSNTLLGRELLDMLPQSGLPLWKVRLLGGEESSGQLAEFNGEPQLVETLSEDSIQFLDAVLFCEGAGLSKKSLPLLEKLDILGFDVGGESGFYGGYRTAVAGVTDLSPSDIRLYRNPHPVTVILVELLKNLLTEFSFQRAYTLGFLPAASRGEGGLEELCKQTAGLLNMTGCPTDVFHRQLAFNLIPVTGERAKATEKEITGEIAHILPEAPAFRSITLFNAPLFHCLSILLVLEGRKKLRRERLAHVLDRDPDLITAIGEEAATASEIGESEEIMVSLLPLDEKQTACRLWIVGDQTKRASCRNALRLLSSRLAAEKPKLESR